MNDKDFWSKLTPEEAFRAIQTEPKIAGPWQGKLGEWSYRADGHGQYVAHTDVGEIKVCGTFPDFVATREEADELLRKLGWILL